MKKVSIVRLTDEERSELKALIRTASRRAFRGYPKRQLPMWHAYRVELYPHYGQLCGIRDEFGHELEFPSAFRKSRRDGRPRGIVKIVPEP